MPQGDRKAKRAYKKLVQQVKDRGRTCPMKRAQKVPRVRFETPGLLRRSFLSKQKTGRLQDGPALPSTVANLEEPPNVQQILGCPHAWDAKIRNLQKKIARLAEEASEQNRGVVPCSMPCLPDHRAMGHGPQDSHLNARARFM